MRLLSLLAGSLVGCLFFAAAGCQSDSPPPVQGQGGASVAPEPQPVHFGQCERLFGAPSSKTGLTPDQCSPVCYGCGNSNGGNGGAAPDGGNGDYQAISYSAEEIAALRNLAPEMPAEPLGVDPYEAGQTPAESLGAICAVKVTGESYELMTVSSAAEAAALGAVVTHEGACGQCSSLQDLAVYIESPDLTGPVRKCAVTYAVGELAPLVECLAEIGFSPACAEIWAFNSRNTAAHCRDVCLENLDKPHHLPDGSLNACIACDEAVSGPIFKAVSGRTRRNSGLPTGLCRPCDDVARISHHYLD